MSVPRPSSLQPWCDDQVGQRLAELRKERDGMSQRRLAAGICTAVYVSRIESGQRRPSLQMIKALAERLDVEPEEIAWGRKIEGRRRFLLKQLEDATPGQLRLLVQILELVQGAQDSARRPLPSRSCSGLSPPSSSLRFVGGVSIAPPTHRINCLLHPTSTPVGGVFYD